MVRRRWLSLVASVSLMGSLLVFGGVEAQAAPVPSPLVPTVPAIAGNAKVGRTLTAMTGTWQPAPVTLSYQWYRSGAVITGATQPKYLLVAADKGKTMTVTVTGTKEGYASAFRTSKPTVKVVPGTLSTATPAITGYPKVEKTLTAVPGTWGPAPVVLTYQWFRSGKAIAGATGATYTLVAADSGKQVTVKVTGWKAGYDTAVTTSKKTKKVTAGSLIAAVPVIKGQAVVGKTLTITRGTWKPSGLKFSYQWSRSGKKISKAKKSTYKLVSADKGKKITVKVTGAKKGYSTTSRTSLPTAAVVLSTSGGTPRITGYEGFGEPIVSLVLTANPGSWKPTGMSFSYRWYANGVAIAGATSRTLRVNGAYVGKRLTVAVTGKKGGYATVTKLSPATPTVSADGIYYGGVDLANGTYVAKGGSECIWWRLSTLNVDLLSAGLDTPGVLGVSRSHTGQPIVTVSSADPYLVSLGCGQWTKLQSTPSFRTSVGDGDYAVGIHLQPGVWKSTTMTSQCYVEFASGFAGNRTEVIEYGKPLIDSVTIFADDVRFSSVGCGTWTRTGPVPRDPDTSTKLKQVTVRPAVTRADLAKVVKQADKVTRAAGVVGAR